MTLAGSHLRVAALADVSQRYGAIITSLQEAIGEVLTDVPPEVEVRLVRAIEDASAQLAATIDALDKQIEAGKLLGD